MRRSGRGAAAVLVVLGLAVSTACSLVPDSGEVHRPTDTRGLDPDDQVLFAPPGPGIGDSPTAIVKGFLLAMTAVPQSTSVARSFVADDVRADWNPNRSTLIYQSQTLTRTPDGVRVNLGSPTRLDPRGGWAGQAGDDEGRIDLRLVKDQGQWRIANPPDSVIVPQWFLESVYRPYNLYFFDQTDRLLVPDRIYVPRGDQTPSTLVRSLLAGPGPDVAAVTRTAFPSQTQLDLSVQVSPDGTAEVPLSKELTGLEPARLKRVVAQLAWTLRQVPGLNRIRLTAGGAPVFLSDGRRDFSVQEGDAYAPTVRGASDKIFGLQKGVLVGVHDGTAERVPGPLGKPGFALRSVAAALTTPSYAAVAKDGRTVFGWQRSGAVRRLYAGQDVLRPAYDMFGTLWLIDRGRNGASVWTMRSGRLQRVGVPGVSGSDVHAFLVSRDGSRLVAAVAGNGSDRLVVADLLREGSGAVARVLPAHRISSVPAGLGRIRALAWRTPNDLAALGGTSKFSQVAYLALDGSLGDAKRVLPDLYRGKAIGLLGSPDASQPLYLITGPGSLDRLNGDGHWVPSSVARGLVAPTYAG